MQLFLDILALHTEPWGGHTHLTMQDDVMFKVMLSVAKHNRAMIMYFIKLF